MHVVGSLNTYLLQCCSPTQGLILMMLACKWPLLCFSFFLLLYIVSCACGCAGTAQSYLICLMPQVSTFKMGNRNSVTLQPEEVERMQNETGFSPSQIERLYSRFTTLDKFGNGTLSREDLLRIPELAINPLGDRIVHAFFRDSEDEAINFLQFLKTLAIFRPIRKNREMRFNSRDQKLQFAFRMYDLDGDDLISREELLCVLHMMVGANISDEQLASIADRTIREVDQDNDDAISFTEFSEALKRTEVEGKMSIRYLN